MKKIERNLRKLFQWPQLLINSTSWDKTSAEKQTRSKLVGEGIVTGGKSNHHSESGWDLEGGTSVCKQHDHSKEKKEDSGTHPERSINALKKFLPLLLWKLLLVIPPPPLNKTITLQITRESNDKRVVNRSYTTKITDKLCWQFHSHIIIN